MEVDVNQFGFALGFMTLLGVSLSSVLAVANRFLYVFEDPRIDDVEDLLPKTNCGACGSAGCRTFAESLIQGDLTPANCTVCSKEDLGAIADYLGVDAGNVVKRVARLACAGGTHVARQRAHYSGLDSCRAASVVGGGPKSCSWGCLGLADCVDVCDQGAITLDKHGLPVVDSELCTACNDCVEICPKRLFSLQPITHQLWVACNNRLFDEEAEAQCEVACTACEKCSKDAPEGLIQIQNNLAQIDYSRNPFATPIIIDRCPTGAIVWLDEKSGSRKGSQAKTILREEALPS